jgi:hypothetical protein
MDNTSSVGLQGISGSNKSIDLFGEYNFAEKHICWILYGNYPEACLNDLISKVDETSKIIVANFKKNNISSCDSNDFDKSIDLDRLEVIVDDDLNNLADSVAASIDRNKFDRWRPLLEKSYIKRDGVLLKKLYSLVGEAVNNFNVFDNTTDKHLNTHYKNALKNLPIIKYTHRIEDINNNYDGRPALIVSAGPSLLKQLPILEKYQRLFTIIAATATYPNLKKFGIEPDYLIALDPENKVVWGDDTTSKLILDIGCDPETVWSIPEKTILCTHHPLIKDLLKKLGFDIDLLPTGGSVATSAFSLAKMIGSNPIIMIGQDLAYKNGDKRVEGYAFSSTENSLSTPLKSTFKVAAFGGHGEVETDSALLMFKNWFEKEFINSPHLNIINCTEGGAEIKGATSLTFGTVCNELEKYSLPKMNWESDISQDKQHALSLAIDNLSILLSEVQEYQRAAIDGIELAEPMLAQKLSIDLTILDAINARLKNTHDHVKNFCDSYSTKVMRNFKKNVVRESNANDFKVVGFYLDIYLITKDAAAEAEIFLNKLIYSFKSKLIEK